MVGAGLKHHHGAIDLGAKIGANDLGANNIDSMLGAKNYGAMVVAMSTSRLYRRLRQPRILAPKVIVPISMFACWFQPAQTSQPTVYFSYDKLAPASPN